MKYLIKKSIILAYSATVLTVLFPIEVNAARMINHWGFDSFNGTTVGELQAVRINNGNTMTNSYNSGKQWDLTVDSHGDVTQSANSSLRGNGNLPTNPYYYPHQYMPDSILDQNILNTYGSYGAHAHLGATTGGGGNYLHAEGDTLDFSKTWAYSIVSWVNPEVTHGSLSLFSIGDQQQGLSFVFDPTSQSLQLYMYKDNGGGGYDYDGYGVFKLAHAFTGTSSNWHHVGFSIANENGELTVNYYVEGEIAYTGTKDNSFLADKTLNGFNVGLSKLTGPNVGSCNYDDIKIFEGVLNNRESMEALNPGAVPAASIPESSTASLLLFGLSGLTFRRRR